MCLTKPPKAAQAVLEVGADKEGLVEGLFKKQLDVPPPFPILSLTPPFPHSGGRQALFSR